MTSRRPQAFYGSCYDERRRGNGQTLRERFSPQAPLLLYYKYF